MGATASYVATTYLPFETRVYDELDTTEENWLYPAITKVDGQGRVAVLPLGSPGSADACVGQGRRLDVGDPVSCVWADCDNDM